MMTLQRRRRERHHRPSRGSLDDVLEKREDVGPKDALAHAHQTVAQVVAIQINKEQREERERKRACTLQHLNADDACPGKNLRAARASRCRRLRWNDRTIPTRCSAPNRPRKEAGEPRRKFGGRTLRLCETAREREGLARRDKGPVDQRDDEHDADKVVKVSAAQSSRRLPRSSPASARRLSKSRSRERLPSRAPAGNAAASSRPSTSSAMISR